MNRNLCKIVLEQHYKVPFKKTMVNGFSIDFYNKELMVGLMLYSVHHYKYSSKFHKVYRKFVETKNRDILRRKTCDMMGIKLIVIPYNVECVIGMLRRRLKVTNDCRCTECMFMRRLSEPSRAKRLVTKTYSSDSSTPESSSSSSDLEFSELNAP